MIRILFLLCFFITADALDLSAQERRRSYKTVRGKVKDHNDQPVKNAFIFIDMVKTDVRTNKKGEYKIRIAPVEKLISVYHEKHGYVNWEYGGEKKINFVYPEDSDPVTQEQMEDLGFDFQVPEKNWYAGFADVTDILDAKFTNVRVINDQIIVGLSGTNVVTGDTRPLILVNDVPTQVSQLDVIPTTEIHSIEVLDKASQTSAYGFRGVNGVIIIQLKSGETELEE